MPDLAAGIQTIARLEILDGDFGLFTVIAGALAQIPQLNQPLLQTADIFTVVSQANAIRLRILAHQQVVYFLRQNAGFLNAVLSLEALDGICRHGAIEIGRLIVIHIIKRHQARLHLWHQLRVFHALCQRLFDLGLRSGLWRRLGRRLDRRFAVYYFNAGDRKFLAGLFLLGLRQNPCLILLCLLLFILLRSGKNRNRCKHEDHDCRH